MVTIWIAHMTFSMAYVTVVRAVAAGELDQSLEEAAMDLGAKPAQGVLPDHLADHRLPMLAGWLLAFTLSWTTW